MIQPQKLTLAVIASFVLMFQYACRKDNAIDNDLDAQLADALFEASDGQGTGYYKFPDSDDFANIPQDPNNPLSHSKVELGRLLYHETGLALNPKNGEALGTYSCATCHHAQAGFQANRAQGVSDGGVGFGAAGEGREVSPIYATADIDVQPVRTPSAMNGAYQECQLWNGQFGATGPNANTEAHWTPGTPIETNNFGYEGLEIQAIAGLNVHRMVIDTNFILAHPTYVELFDLAFADRPSSERISRETAGLAIAAYERTLLANQAPFQRWLNGNYTAMTESQKRGAIYFFGKGECASCHNGPALNSMAFYALGFKDFNPSMVFNFENEELPQKGRGGFTKNASDDYKFKVPQLYNLKDSRFYGHGASFTDLKDVVEYKNNATKENADIPDSQIASEFHDLGLSEQEIDDIVNFLEDGLHDPDLMRYVPSRLPSGNCFPNNDVLSQIDLGCQ